MIVADLAPIHERNMVARREEEVVEIPLLLPTRQAADLERAASAHGLTTGELARRLIRAFLGQRRDGPAGPGLQGHAF